MRCGPSANSCTATAESCTAGLIAARLADVPGALRHTRAHLPTAHTGVTDNTDPAIPAVTQCFAWHCLGSGTRPNAVFSETRRFQGERNDIREQAAAYALARIPARHAGFMRGSAPPAAL